MAKLRWALVGCGDIAKKRVAPALRDLENCDFVAVTRAKSELARAFAEQFGARRFYDTLNGLLTDEEIQAVYVATPVYLHAEHTIAAAEAGKHVLCEKPMAMNLAECDRMIAACRTNGVQLGVAYYRHFYPLVGRVKEIIDSGEIGRVVFVQINAFEYYNPPPGDARHWFVEKDKAGGGPMFDFGCHRIEVLLNILGSIKRARGFFSNVVFDLEVEDTATACLSFDCGANAILNVTRAGCEAADTLDIFGDKGSIHIPVLNDGFMAIMINTEQPTRKYPPHPNVHQPLIDDFTQAVLGGREPAVGADLGREVNRILEQIYGS